MSICYSGNRNAYTVNSMMEHVPEFSWRWGWGDFPVGFSQGRDAVWPPASEITGRRGRTWRVGGPHMRGSRTAQVIAPRNTGGFL